MTEYNPFLKDAPEEEEYNPFLKEVSAEEEYNPFLKAEEDTSISPWRMALDPMNQMIMGVGDVIGGGIGMAAGGIVGGARAIQSGDLNKVRETVEEVTNWTTPSGLVKKFAPESSLANPVNNTFRETLIDKPLEQLEKGAYMAGEATASGTEGLLGREGSAMLGAGVNTALQLIPFGIGAGTVKGAIRGYDPMKVKPGVRERVKALEERQRAEEGISGDMLIENRDVRAQGQAREIVQEVINVSDQDVFADRMHVIESQEAMRKELEASRDNVLREDHVFGKWQDILSHNDDGKEVTIFTNDGPKGREQALTGIFDYDNGMVHVNEALSVPLGDKVQRLNMTTEGGKVVTLHFGPEAIARAADDANLTAQWAAKADVRDNNAQEGVLPPDMAFKKIKTHDLGQRAQLLQMREALADAQSADHFEMLIENTLADSPLKAEILANKEDIYRNQERILAIRDLKGKEGTVTEGRLANTHESVRELSQRLTGTTHTRGVGDLSVMARVLRRFHKSEDWGFIGKNFAQADTLMSELKGVAGELFRGVAQKTFDMVRLGKVWLQKTTEMMPTYDRLKPEGRVALNDALFRLEHNLRMIWNKEDFQKLTPLEQEKVINDLERKYIGSLPQELQVAAGEVRAVMEKTFKTINIVRGLRGLEPIKYHRLYMPHMWMGKFTVAIETTTKDGDKYVYGLYSFDSMAGARKFAKQVQKSNIPNVHIKDLGQGQVNSPSHKYQPADLMAVIEDTYSRLDTTGMDLSLRKALNEMVDQALRKSFAHEKQRAGVHGFIGDPFDAKLGKLRPVGKKELKAVNEMMTQYLETVANYLKDAQIEQLVRRPLSEMAERGVFDNTPRIHSGLAEFISRNTEKPHMWLWSRNLNNWLDNASNLWGRLPWNFQQMVSALNGYAYHAYMFLRPGYLVGNLTQPFHAVGRLMNAHVLLQADGIYSGNYEKAVATITHLVATPGAMSKLRRTDSYIDSAMKYMEDSGYIQITNALHMDAAHMISTRAARAAAQAKAGQASQASAARAFWSEISKWAKDDYALSIGVKDKLGTIAKTPVKTYHLALRHFYEALEQRNRSAVAMGFLDYFRDVYKDDPVKAANAAVRLMNKTMGSYERGRGAGAYTHAGHVGTAMKPFTTLRNQYIGNLVEDLVTIRTVWQKKGMDPLTAKAFAPVLLSQGTYLVLAGTMGMVGMKEAEAIYDYLIRPLLPDDAPRFSEVLNRFVGNGWFRHGAVAMALPGQPAVGPSLASPTLEQRLPPSVSVPIAAGKVALDVGQNVAAHFGFGQAVPSQETGAAVRSLAPAFPSVTPGIQQLQDLGKSLQETDNFWLNGIGLALRSTNRLGAEKAWSGDAKVSPFATKLGKGSYRRSPEEEAVQQLYGTPSITETAAKEKAYRVSEAERKFSEKRTAGINNIVDSILGISGEVPREAIKKFMESKYGYDSPTKLWKAIERRLKERNLDSTNRIFKQIATTSDPVRRKYLIEAAQRQGLIPTPE